MHYNEGEKTMNTLWKDNSAYKEQKGRGREGEGEREREKAREKDRNRGSSEKVSAITTLHQRLSESAQPCKKPQLPWWRQAAH